MTIDESFSEDELVETANQTALTAFHAGDDDDGEAWLVAKLAVAILAKIETAHPALVEFEGLRCTREMLVRRRQVENRANREQR